MKNTSNGCHVHIINCSNPQALPNVSLRQFLKHVQVIMHVHTAVIYLYSDAAHVESGPVKGSRNPPPLAFTYAPGE